MARILKTWVAGEYLKKQARMRWKLLTTWLLEDARSDRQGMVVSFKRFVKDLERLIEGGLLHSSG